MEAWDFLSNGTSFYTPAGGFLRRAQPTPSVRRAELSRLFPLDVREFEDHYLIEMEVPGVTQDRISVELEGSHLTLSVSEVEAQAETGGYVHRERRAGVPVKRLVRLSEVASPDVGAVLKDGILKVTVQKRKESLPRKIEIKVES